MAILDYLDVYFSVQSFQEEDLRGKSAVIIDVLRAASSMVTALSNGAKKIIPVGAMEDAVKMKFVEPEGDMVKVALDLGIVFG